jgi:hypothetical protein
MPIPLCRHIHTAGTRCGSPALVGMDFCFFHQRLHFRHKAYVYRGKMRKSYEDGTSVEIGTLEDRTSIQLALSLVINALAARDLEVKRGNAILYGLQLASMNLPRGGSLIPQPQQVVRAALQTCEGLVIAADDPISEETALPSVLESSSSTPASTSAAPASSWNDEESLSPRERPHNLP